MSRRSWAVVSSVVAAAVVVGGAGRLSNSTNGHWWVDRALHLYGTGIPSSTW